METLTSSDGKFQCAPEHAVELAYMLSTAEALIHDPGTILEFEILDGIRDYLKENKTPEEVQKYLLEP